MIRRQRILEGYSLILWFGCVLLCCLGEFQDCPVDNCPTFNDIDLSPLKGVWDTVYFTKADGEQTLEVPSFFNLSLCGPLPSPQSCANSRLCYSEHLDTFQNLGATCKYEYDSGIKQIRFLFDYAPDLVFGNGNVSVTLVCGRTLGVPEVLEGDPNSHAISILWVTSAACKNSSSLSPNHQELKCYHVHPYVDNGLKAKFIDLTDLIDPDGYIVTYPEDPNVSFKLSVCRPIERGVCSGSMACLTSTSSNLGSGITAPMVLGKVSRESSSLHVEGELLTVVYSLAVTSGACFDTSSQSGNHSVKIHFICPVGNEDLGPRVTFLDSNLCLVVIHWYTSFACGNSAIQSTGCTLTTSQGTTFDLTGLTDQQTVAPNSESDSNGAQYQYDFKICSANSLSTGCPARDDGQPIRVTQIDNNGFCRVLGVGEGKLRYVDGELTLMYGMGDPCHSHFLRTTIIHFICPENVESSNSTVTYSGEDSCFYQFEWVTPLACGAQGSGLSSCQFEVAGSTYNLAQLVGTENENWIALDYDRSTECFIINPCGSLAVAPDTETEVAEYCNKKLAPAECAGTSVCQVKKDGTFKKIGKFELESNSTHIHSSDSSVVSIVGDEGSSSSSAVIHYVCKVGDLTTPPIFIGITNQVLYEFHWMTYAACPTGVETGNDCTVRHHSTGFVFNLTSLPVVTFTKGEFQYTVSVCKPLGQSECSTPNTAVCQTQQTHHYSLGLANSTLEYVDGTLKLRYTGGTKCKHNGEPNRNSTLIFVCDNTAHSPVINDISEDYCDYVIEIRTKQACPPPYQAHSCVHFSKTNAYDFSALSRASDAGNWEARGRDGSVYYINICQPLNSVAGCSPLAAVCRVKGDESSKAYINIAQASSANFTQAGEDINLKYEYKSLVGGCSTVTTTIRFVCNKTELISSQAGPKYVSGGDEASPCDYLFTWETVYACPVHPVMSRTCSIKDPVSNFVYDLQSLSDGFHSVKSSEGHTYHISVCNALDHDCSSDGDTGQVAVCQYDSNNHTHRCGFNSTQKLTYFDGSLTMKYDGGDVCNHNSRQRSVLINFECDHAAGPGSPRFVSENEDCGYTFDWPSSLACPPREIECVAGGGRYDLRPLLQSSVWRVGGTPDIQVYVIGGCRSLGFEGLDACPQVPGVGACRYSGNDGPGEGTALGYITGDIAEESSGNLVLTYTNGDCATRGKRGVVHVHFQCGESTGHPVLVSDDSTNCVVRIDWTTKYACPRDQRVTDWFIEDPVTHQAYNLTALPSSLSQRYFEAESNSEYEYTVALGGKGVVNCSRPWKQDNEIYIGACQHTLTNLSNQDTHNVHALGFVNANTTLQYINGAITVEYLNGDECHHVARAHRKAVVGFTCEPSRDDFLEVFPERECEYTFLVHTQLVCGSVEELVIPCILANYSSLDVLQSLGVMEARVNENEVAYLSVCGSLDSSDERAKGCPLGAAACLKSTSGEPVHLGKPSASGAPVELAGGEGVLLVYSAGQQCETDNKKRYSTRLLLICNRNIPTGAPEFVSLVDCEYTFRLESINACPVHLSYTNSSKNVCSIDDPSSQFLYTFTPLLKGQTISVEDPKSSNIYIIQLCGTNVPLPAQAKGCEPLDTGVCLVKPDASRETVVYATHKLVITSHTPHTVEVVFITGSKCRESNNWSATVSLQCSTRKSSTPNPVLVSSDNCLLDFVWQNSSFCLGEKPCSVADSNGYVYNFDGLFSQKWTGIVTDSLSVTEGATFTMSVCRNLNPFSGDGSHCSSPAGVCMHSLDGGHLNLGHMTGPPTIQASSDPHPTIQAVYSDGDVCNPKTGARYTTTLFLHCANQPSTPILSPHDDSNNCSWTVAMETPLACPPDKNKPSDESQCVMSTSLGEFDFTPLGKSITFDDDDDVSYTVCLCESSACQHPGINSTNKATNKLTNLGAIGDHDNTVVSTVTGGPRISFSSNGSPCGKGSSTIQSIIFMECNRKADITKGELILQTAVSDDCYKYFFWSTPYACVSEEISCSVSTEKDVLYDFSPLHSLVKPWQISGAHGETYYINICGAIENRIEEKLEGCGPQSSICVRSSNGELTSLALTYTQRMRVVGEDVVVNFATGSSLTEKCPAHATVTLICGVSGPSLAAQPSNDCPVLDFTWATPYACEEHYTGNHEDIQCSDGAILDGLYSFYPSKLTKSKDYNASEGGAVYYVNLCGKASHCADEVSVCDNQGNSIASHKTQYMMVEGYQLLFVMTQGQSHAIVRVVCLLPEGSDPDPPKPDQMTVENIGEQNEHTYYYFVIYTKTGCSFTTPKTKAPNPTTQSPQAVSPASGGAAVIVIIVIAVLALIVVVLVLVFYKRERRAAGWRLLERLVVGKADEPVRYHKVSQEDEDEETALMGDTSDSETSSNNGEDLPVNADISRDQLTHTISDDDELLNI